MGLVQFLHLFHPLAVHFLIVLNFLDEPPWTLYIFCSVCFHFLSADIVLLSNLLSVFSVHGSGTCEPCYVDMCTHCEMTTRPRWLAYAPPDVGTLVLHVARTLQLCLLGHI